MLLNSCFQEPLRGRVRDLLLARASENIPHYEDSTPEKLERVRFAIIKLTLENSQNLENAVEQAQFDWRDLFMMAGFGHDAEEHNHWFTRTIQESAG